MKVHSRVGSRAALSAAFLGLVALLGFGDLAAAQRPAVSRSGNDRQGPPIRRLEVTVEDLDAGQMLAPIEPKGMVVIRSGQRVRLRMTAVPANPNQSVRYPATRFTPNESQRHLRIDKVNEEVGTILVTGLRPHGAAGAVPIVYEVLEPWPMSDDLRSGRTRLPRSSNTA